MPSAFWSVYVRSVSPLLNLPRLGEGTDLGCPLLTLYRTAAPTARPPSWGRLGGGARAQEGPQGRVVVPCVVVEQPRAVRLLAGEGAVRGQRAAAAPGGAVGVVRSTGCLTAARVRGQRGAARQSLAVETVSYDSAQIDGGLLEIAVVGSETRNSEN